MIAMKAAILLVGTLDTKGHEFAFARTLINARGHETILMDAGVVGAPATVPDIGAVSVARAGGSSLEALRAAGDRAAALDVMIRGACALAAELHAEGRIAAVLGLGGSGGTAIATAVMRILPVGVPKVMLSTLASGDVGPYVGVKDITMMHSVVDIAGLNRISRPVIANAVGAVCGMVEQPAPISEDRPLIAATMFGVTTPCVMRVREELAAAGYDVVVFHATGTGGRAMEALIDSGFFVAVADITTTEWCDEVVGGVLSAGPDRLGAAARCGIPQVVSCGALDMVNFRGLNTVPAQFRSRNLVRHNANVTLMRTSQAECRSIGEHIASQISRAKGPVHLLIPLKGVSAIDLKGKPFHDPAANAALFNALRQNVAPSVEVVALDLHINDEAFARAVAEHLLSLLPSP